LFLQGSCTNVRIHVRSNLDIGPRLVAISHSILCGGKPLWWALEQIGIVDNDSEDHQNSNSLQADWFGEYVFVELLEHAADAVLTLQETHATGPADALYTIDGFRKTFASIFSVSEQSALSETDAKVLIKFLEQERKAVVTDNEVSPLRPPKKQW